MPSVLYQPQNPATVAHPAAYAVSEIVGIGQALEFRSTRCDFSVRLSTSGPRNVAEHAHDNIQISIPLGATVARVAWRRSDGSQQHALARRGHALIVPAGQRHAVAWKNRAHFVNVHLSAATASDARQGLLRRIAGLGEAHLIEDPFLARLGEIVVSLCAQRTVLDDAMLLGLRDMVETHIMQPYSGAAPAENAAAVHAVDANPTGRVRAQSRSPETTALPPAMLRKTTTAVLHELDRDWTVIDMARGIGMSAGHFSRAFRRSTGTSPRQWLIQRRIDAAMEMLRGGGDPLAEIALACGFSDQTHFTRTFTRIAGISPGAWRRRHAMAEGDVAPRACGSRQETSKQIRAVQGASAAHR
jgi:AraC-like DNA-binding protein